MDYLSNQLINVIAAQKKGIQMEGAQNWFNHEKKFDNIKIIKVSKIIYI